MTGSNFWERKKAQLEAQQPQAPVTAPNGAWWAQGSDILQQRQTVPQNGVQSQPELSGQNPNIVNGHDVSKIGMLKGDAYECPNCPPDPETGIRGNMYRATKTSVLRCFDCGYMEDSRFVGETSGLIAVKEGPTRQARQTASGGAVIRNYHGDITSVDQAVGRWN